MNVLEADEPPPVTLADHEARARRRLAPAIAAWLFGGAADELTLAANTAAWADLRLRPRVLRPLRGGSTRITLLGRTLAAPILVAPMAWHRLVHPLGEAATAAAAAAQGLGFVLGTQTSVDLHAVARAHGPAEGDGCRWFQLYLQRDRALTRALVEAAEAAGYQALVVTVDAPCSGARDRERRAGFRLPPGVGSAHLPAASSEGAGPLNGGGLCGGLADAAPTWDDIGRLVDATRLPVLVKGILHPDDARQAVDLGVAGVIVSNHGGRTLDTALPTAHALPEIVRAVRGEVPVLVDGGLRRGTDVLKALALGARAVLVGRPVLAGLASAGPQGAAQVLRLLRDELEIAMTLCGCATLDQINPDLLAAPGFPSPWPA